MEENFWKRTVGKNLKLYVKLLLNTKLNKKQIFRNNIEFLIASFIFFKLLHRLYKA